MKGGVEMDTSKWPGWVIPIIIVVAVLAVIGCCIASAALGVTTWRNRISNVPEATPVPAGDTGGEADAWTLDPEWGGDNGRFLPNGGDVLAGSIGRVNATNVCTVYMSAGTAENGTHVWHYLGTPTYDRLMGEVPYIGCDEVIVHQ